MTQVFSVVTRNHVLHVSDRLISRQRDGASAVAFDRNSNKAVIFCARDAHVVVAFTGRAFLDHIPTDTFVAQSLAGANLTSRGAFFGIGARANWLDIGRSVERLRHDLTAAFRRLPVREREANFQVSILGWRQRYRRNRRIMPVVWHLERSTPDTDSEFQVQRHLRWWGWDRGYALSIIPEVSQEMEHWIRHHLRERGGESPAALKQVLIEAMCKCASTRADTVGRSCIQIVLTPTTKPQARIRYIADVCAPEQRASGTEAYSPWIVAPPMAYAPAVMRGSTEGGGWSSPNYTWIYEGPLGELSAAESVAVQGMKRRTVVAHSSQPRRADPQRRN